MKKIEGLRTLRWVLTCETVLVIVFHGFRDATNFETQHHFIPLREKNASITSPTSSAICDLPRKLSHISEASGVKTLSQGSSK